MKKSLLSLAAVLLGTMAVSAEEVVTFDITQANITKWGYTAPEEGQGTNLEAGKPLTEGKVSIDVKQNPDLNPDGQIIRFYQSSGQYAGEYSLRNSAKGLKNSYIFTSTGENITKIEFTVGQNKFALTQNGTAVSNNTWTGNAASVEFVTTGANTFTKITVTLGGEGGEVTPPVVEPDVKTEGNGTQLDPFTVADVIKLNNTYTEPAWVGGYIVGYINGKSITENYVFGIGDIQDANTNILLAATADETDINKCIPVALPAKSKLRTDLNLVDRPALIGREVSILGNLVKYFGVPGLKDGTDYTIAGGLPAVPVTEVASLTEFVEEQNTTTMFKITGEVTVFYQNAAKNYTFITDGTSNLEVYGTLTNAYTNGDKLSGIIGKFGYFQNMPQMSPDASSFGEATKGTAVEPVKVTAYADVKPNDYVLIEGATIEAKTTTAKDGKDVTTYTITDGATELTLFNRFDIEGLAAARNVNILGIGAVYGETKQIFPITIGDTTGISEITAGAKADNAVYDLQGRRLAAPVKGINIINGKKVLVK